MSDDPTPAVAPRVHGGIAGDELGLLGVDANDVVDFSSSTTPTARDRLLTALRQELVPC